MPLFAILTLFPEALEPYLRASIVGIAQAKGLVRIQLVDFRDFARDRHRSVDDRPYGGGPGMVLRPEPIVECVEWLEARHGRFRKIVLCPAGRVFGQTMADELTREERVLLLCGRYEGIDARVEELLHFEPLSIGDYVLSGGELPALVVTEAVVRLLPGALGDERSLAQESFGARADAPALDHPHYTRPPLYRGLAVPEVLASGDHAAIERWRREQARARTERWRPDLAGGSGTTAERAPTRRQLQERLGQHEEIRPTAGLEAGDAPPPAGSAQPDEKGAPEERPRER